MTHRSIAAIAAGAFLMLASAGAQALPARPDAAAPAPLVERVAEGCGPGFFRGRRGFCRPFPGRGYGRGYGRRFYGPPPRFYGPRRYYGPRYYGRPRYYRF